MQTWYCFGEIRQSEFIDLTTMQEIVAQGKALIPRIRSVPVGYILDVLHEVGRRLRDVDHPLRRMAHDQLGGMIGFSAEMVEEGLQTLAEILDREHLRVQLECDLGAPVDVLDTFIWVDRFEGYVKAVSRGLLGHVSAGNVFVGAADSLVRGLVTKNVNLMKMASIDPLFPVLFARLIQDCDPNGDVAAAIAMVPFPGGAKELEAELKRHCDTLMVYGGKETVLAYREGLSLHTKLLEYGPKYSCMMLEASEVHHQGLEFVAETVARDFSLWNQSACSSPHVVFIDDDNTAQAFARALAVALERWSLRLPHGEIPYQERVEITRTRELARVEQALGNGELLLPTSGGQDWTVIVDRTPRFRVSCQHRTAYVKPVASFDEAMGLLAEYGTFIQSVGILASEVTRFRLADQATALGADRITEIGWMTRRKYGSPHDGGKGLSELVRWVSMGHRTPFVEAFDYQPQEGRNRKTLSRLNHLLALARDRAPFYRDRIPDRPLRTLEELRTVPVLTPAELREHLPPAGEGLLTGPLEGAIAFSSSGTSGTPKSVYRTIAETHRNALAIAKGLRLSILEPGDRVANLLFAGHLWASFLSYTQALEHCGVLILPIGGHIPLEVMVSYLQTFQPTAAISLPTVFLSLARYVETEGLEVRIPKIISGGEHLWPEGKAYLSRVLGVERFASTGYTSNDTGAIAYQCSACEGGVHHLHEDLVYVEVVDPETLAPVPDGSPGKVLVTNLHRELMPMIRYDVGDLGRILPEPCACGRSVRLFELLGRSDDTMRIGTNLVTLESVGRAVGNVPGLGQAFRMVVCKEGGLDHFLVEAETFQAGDAARAKELEALLKVSLAAEMEDVVKEMTDPATGRLTLRVLPPGALLRNSRTGKIKQVVDERN